MEAWSIIYYITSLAILIVPIILCYKIFSKGGKGSYCNGSYIFSIINFSPAYAGGVTIMIDSFSTLMLIVWIIGSVLGLGIALVNYTQLHKNAKTSHDDYAFNHASGLIGCYAFLYFVMYGTLILLIEDDEDFDFFELAYRKHAWIYYFVELIYFSGLFLSTCAEYFILKHDLNKIILAFLIIVQSLLYTLNIVIILDFKVIFIVILAIVSLAEISYGLFLFIKYYSDNDPEEISNTFKL